MQSATSSGVSLSFSAGNFMPKLGMNPWSQVKFA